MKLFGNILLFLICSVSVMAQNNLSLSGKLIESENNEPVPAGSVELLNSKDSTYVAGAITKLDGTFSMQKLSKGNYVIKASYLGYITTYKSVSIDGKQTNLNIGNILMQADDVLLAEALVEGKRPDMIVKKDTVEYDAQAYKVPENSAIEELLKKLPGVEVDSDGKITHNGKEIKKFLVDGKEFFTDDPQVASKNLPAEMVEKLQVYERKSEMAQLTGFDDGEEETTINITVREGMKQGIIGNALIGAGADIVGDNDFRYQAAGFLNAMKNSDRLTLILGTNNNNNMGAADLGANQFGGMRVRRGSGGVTETTNIMLNANKEFNENLTLNGDFRFMNLDRVTESRSETLESSLFDKANSNNNNLSQSISANFRLDWKPDSLNTFIFRPNIRFNKSESEEFEHSERFDYPNMDTLFISDGQSFSNGSGLSFGGSLDYSHKFKKPGRNFTISIRGNYSDDYSIEDAYSIRRLYEEAIYTSDEIIDRRFENDNNTNNFDASVSWVEPLKNNFFLQAFYRASYRDTKSLNSTYDLTSDPADEDADRMALLSDSLSRSTLRNSFEQRISLNLKMVREKYQLTFGLNVDPSSSINETYQPTKSQIHPEYLKYPYDSRLANILGDSLISSIEQKVVNFSPVLNLYYNFGERTNLRINYEGRTNQPSASQLRDYIDTTRPTNWVEGNPNLKPGYSNRLWMRFSKYYPATQLVYNIDADGRFSTNDIVSVTERLDGGIRKTTYENVNGNWNVSARGTFNMPLKNKKFSINGFLNTGYSNSNSYLIERGEKISNTGRNLNIGGRFGADYRSDLFDFGVNLSTFHTNLKYTAASENNRNTTNYRLGANTTWYLPYNFTIQSDISWTKRDGYGEEFDIPETMWNASVTKQLFNKKFGTGSLKLQAYDILQNRNNVSFNQTANGYRISESNVIPSYFMCSFIYKFMSFPGGSKPDMGMPGEGMHRRGQWGGGRPF